VATIQLCVNIPIFLMVLGGSCLPIIAFYVCLPLLRNKDKSSPFNTHVPATITSIHIGTFRWNDGWVVAAKWVDSRNKKEYTFESYPQDFIPKQCIGEQVVVAFDPEHPTRFSMKI